MEGTTNPAAAQADDEPGCDERSLALVGHLEVKVSALVGETKLRLDELLRLRPGECLKLGRDLDAPVTVFANEKPFARAELVLIEDRLGVRILELV